MLRNIRLGAWFAVLALTLAAGCDSRRPASGRKAADAGAGQGGGPPAAGPKPKDGPRAGPGRAKVEGPEVVTLNPGYDRMKSRILVRRITRPTKANLEFAFYDSNIVTEDPKQYKPKPLGRKVTLAELDFGALEKGTLVDRLDETPLTREEKDTPMSWFAMSEHLLQSHWEAAGDLGEAGARISSENWGDDEIPVPFQQIVRVYLHRDKAGKYQMWVKVEFKPWVGFLDGVDDEDGDGFPEIYGKLPDRVLGDKLVAELVDNYRAEVFTREEVVGTDEEQEGCWFFDLCTYLYPKYNTEMLDKKQREDWPDAKAKKLIGDALECLGGEKPDLIIVARPFIENLYNVFLFEGFAEP